MRRNEKHEKEFKENLKKKIQNKETFSLESPYKKGEKH
jgi:hypothetical protein